MLLKIVVALCLLLNIALSTTVTYPIKFAYINKLSSWASPSAIAKGMAIPGYSAHNNYNYICYTYYLCSGPLDIALVWNNPIAHLGTLFGSTNEQIWTNVKKRYNDAGIKLMVSAFGSTTRPTTEGINPVTCANSLADYAIKTKLDGVDVAYHDTAAFTAGTGQDWLVTFTQTLRGRLPNIIITHAPQAPYFVGTSHYPKNAYIAIEQRVGSMIQFYNVQFYNQGTTPYNTGQKLFNISGGWAIGTSVNQIIAKGIPSNKIVIGKAATINDIDSTSFMSPNQINTAIVKNYPYNKWKTGVMYWQYSSDLTGVRIKNATVGFLKIYQQDTNQTNQTNSSIEVIYPIKFAYINVIASWSSPQSVARGMGIPGYAAHNKYNYICYTFYVCSKPLDIAFVWDNPKVYLGNLFGTTNEQIWTNVKKRYKDAGIKLFVSAFGATQFPTTQGYNPVTCANSLADYVIKTKLDGVDLDYEDSPAFTAGTGQDWLVTFTQTLRGRLPNIIITHAPQAPYFVGTSHYPKNAYIAIEQRVGSMIQFYNVQFYNQGTTPYNTGQKLFNISGGWAIGTSVNQIIAKGIPSNKIVIGKAATINDGDVGSFMTATNINTAITNNYPFNQWKTGVMFWQHNSDPSGSIVQQASVRLMQIYGMTSN